MKTRIMILLCILFFSNERVYGQDRTTRKKKIIVIDAGHGGMDSGAISEQGLQEKDIVLDIARDMVKWNRALLDNHFDIYLTRSTDTLISLNDRVKLVKVLKPEVFISLHCNHNDDSRIKGVEIYTYRSSEPLVKYASSILKELHVKLGLKTRKVKQANFQVLRETEGSTTSLLVELGYMSHKEESNYLSELEKRNAMGLSILMAILKAD